MLVLSRKKNESIVIGDGIEITVVEVRGSVVRLGIKAPASVPVHRDEVRRRIDREELAAGQDSRQSNATMPHDESYGCPSSLEQARGRASKAQRISAAAFRE
jgi:carbon storage regulator